MLFLRAMKDTSSLGTGFPFCPLAIITMVKKIRTKIADRALVNPRRQPALGHTIFPDLTRLSLQPGTVLT